jgi:tRNA (cmo5U34)-methyltransferase
VGDGFVQPERGFRFDANVADGFDDMLSRSVPEYERMRDAVSRFGAPYARLGHVIDLGASRGEASARLMERVAYPRGPLVLVETSAPMRAALEARFGDSAEILDLDLRFGFPSLGTLKAGLVLAVLTLQFIPIERRLRVVTDARRVLREEGAMIVVEKVLGETAETDEALVAVHDETKLEAGYSREEIDRNLLALEGVLVPVTARWNEEMLRSAGFRTVECVWRYANFAAWLALP